MDLSVQYLGDEPNTLRRDWDSATLRWLICASWPYEHAAGNQSIPAVCKSVTDAGPQYLADRFYLPATPRDLRLLERGGIPVFGIESKHELRDFDVVGTSISYLVLLMNFCNTGEAPIWMADKSFKPISKIQEGDEVIGWEWVEGGRWGKQRRLRSSKVLAVMARQAPVVKATLESGRVIRCTPDHKWLSQASAGKGEDSWTTVGGVSPLYGYRERTHDRTVHLGSLWSMVDPLPELTPEQQREADWLAGLYDGEGSANSIAQSPGWNQEVRDRIEKAFDILGIPWAVYTDKKSGVRRYFMHGGRQTYINWLNWTSGVKRAWFEKQVLGFMYGRRDRVMKIEPDGTDTVYSMETETGNYVAWGLASKNCKMLTMSGMPLRWKDREADAGNYPMVIIGGQAYSAPAAMEPVADCLWLGEVESEPGNGGMDVVCARIEQFTMEGLWKSDRIECYRKLALEFPYLHFPRFVATAYRYEDRGLEHPSKQVSGYESLLPGMVFPRRSRKVRDMDKIAYLDKAPLLFSDPALGAGDLEVGRGCPAWCSFCRLSWLTKPYRQRSVAYSAEHAQHWHINMGAVELSPFAPDTPMHTQRKLLIAELLKINDEADSVAMRVDDFIADGDYMHVQALGGMDAVTLGLEGNSQRMRDLVGKGTSDKDVEEAVTRGIRAGIRKFKLFMITNLPGETPADVLRIVRLARRLAAIRDELGQPSVRLQFSWTPLLIEAGTPFQWFAPTPPDHTLIKVAELFRDLKIDFKIGTKADPAKVAFFQLCQRASAEVGEAIIDVLQDLDLACWGGVPRDMRDRLEKALVAHGFRNGFDDCFDERFAGDLFGWEYLDTGVSKDLMWKTYLQMVEFLEGSDADTYDELFNDGYHGNEWVARCDTQCLGKSCGACAPPDLKLRTGYIRAAAADAEFDLASVHPVDQSSIAQRILVPISRLTDYRFVGNDHWRFAVRRAAYMAAHVMENSLPAGFSIAKRSIRFASDGFDAKGIQGADYVEFGVTRALPDDLMRLFLEGMGVVLAPWIKLDETWQPRAHNAALRKDVGVSFCMLPLIEDTPKALTEHLARWDAASYIPLKLRKDSSYFGSASEEVNAKDYVEDLWVTGQGAQLQLKMLLRGMAGPYQVHAVLTGRGSWISTMAQPVGRFDFFTADSTGRAALNDDLLRPPCVVCGGRLPVSLSGHTDDTMKWCPRCLDEASWKVLAGLKSRVPV
jgi:hypothetical protein